MSTKPYQFLVIEDNLADFYLIRSILQRKFPSSEITNAETFKQASSFITSESFFDVILLDLSLPDSQGHSLVKDILKISGDSVVIIITGLEDKEYGLKAINIGIDDYIEKTDLSTSNLYRTITFALERRIASTNLKKANEYIRESGEKFRSLVTQASDTIMTVNLNYNITFINKFDKIFNQSKIQGKNIYSCVPKSNRKKFRELFVKAKKEKSVVNFEFYNTTENNEVSWYSVNIGCLHSSHQEVSGFLLISRDITESKKVEQEILVLNNQLRNFSNSIEMAREDERKHISREIHDEFGQLLAGIKYSIARTLSKKETDVLGIRNMLQKNMLLVDTLIERTRKIARDLRSGILDDFGLEAAIECHFADFTQNTGIQCLYKISNIDPSLSSSHSNAIFRIFQESLTNVAKHSNATKVKLRLEEKNKQLYYTLEDNGVGIDENLLNQRSGVGITCMKERAVMLQGDFKIKKGKTLGTIISVKIPIQ
jgi:PAS domain S-box-containing protein